MTALIVHDPLADQAITIHITVAPGDLPRDDRLVLLTLGVAEALPVSETGTLGELPELIHRAWNAYGVRAQVTAAVEPTTENEVEAPAELVAAVPVGETEAPRPKPPQPKNLSLF